MCECSVCPMTFKAWINHVTALIFDCSWRKHRTEIKGIVPLWILQTTRSGFSCSVNRDRGRALRLRRGAGKKGPLKIRLRTFVRAYRHTRTELTKIWFHTFPLSTFILIYYVKEIDLLTTHSFLLSKPVVLNRWVATPSGSRRTVGSWTPASKVCWRLKFTELRISTCVKQSRRKGPRTPGRGAGKKEAPKSDSIFVTAYRNTRTELTNNWFHTFHLSIFIFN